MNKTQNNWQKLKEWIDKVFQFYLNESDHKMMSIYGTILDKMQESWREKMSKCIRCGRELNTVETLEILYSGICGKCYEEQCNEFVKKINGKYLFGVIEKSLRQQIDQLKQQLAEKDKELNEKIMWLNAEIDTLKSEKENLIRTLEESAEEIREKDTKWQTLKEWISFIQPKNSNDEFINGVYIAHRDIIAKMQELEGEDE